MASVAITSIAAPAATVSAAGQTSSYVALPVSQRLVDTRNSGALAPGATISVAVTGAAPLPAAGTVTAAVLNVTVVPPTAPGYWTVWPHTSSQPTASNLNVDELASIVGAVIPNLVTVPLGVGGKVCLFSQAPIDLVADLAGWAVAVA